MIKIFQGPLSWTRSQKLANLTWHDYLDFLLGKHTFCRNQVLYLTVRLVKHLLPTLEESSPSIDLHHLQWRWWRSMDVKELVGGVLTNIFRFLFSEVPWKSERVYLFKQPRSPGLAGPISWACLGVNNCWHQLTEHMTDWKYLELK